MANLIFSQDAFDSEDWTPTAYTVVNADTTAAPDGSATADQIIGDDSEGTESVNVKQAVTLTDAVHVFSVCAKADNADYLALLNEDFDFAVVGVSYFNLATGAVASKSAAHSDAGIVDVGGGWYQCWFTFQPLTDLTGSIVVAVSSDGVGTGVDLNGANSIIVWRAQVELGSAPTSCASVAAPMQGGGRVLMLGQLPKWWKAWEETQPKQTPPKVIAPRERIAELAGSLKMPRRR